MDAFIYLLRWILHGKDLAQELLLRGISLDEAVKSFEKAEYAVSWKQLGAKEYLYISSIPIPFVPDRNLTSVRLWELHVIEWK